MPKLFTALPKKIDDYLHDRFGLRKQMIGWHANLTKRLLGEGNEQVLVGRGDRMFYLGDDAVRQSAGLVRRDARLAESVDFLVAMRDALEKRGVGFLVALPATMQNSMVATSDTGSKSFMMFHGILACIWGTMVMIESLKPPIV